MPLENKALKVYHQSIKIFILVHHADWSLLNPETGLPPFRDDNAALIYTAACEALDDYAPPPMEGAKVNVGGAYVDAAAVLALGRSLAGLPI